MPYVNRQRVNLGHHHEIRNVIEILISWISKVDDDPLHPLNSKERPNPWTNMGLQAKSEIGRACAAMLKRLVCGSYFQKSIISKETS